MKKQNTVRLASACSGENCCPVADKDVKTGIVTIYDPDKPERGSFKMQAEEWKIFEESIRNK